MQRGFDARAQRDHAVANDHVAVEALELKLSGNDITVETLANGEIVLIGNERDLDVLENFIKLIDRAPPEKEIVLHRLEKASAEEVAVKAVEKEEVHRAVTQLTPAQQEVINLRFSAELSTAETAQAMKKSLAAVKALQHSALVNLRKIMSTQP